MVVVGVETGTILLCVALGALIYYVKSNKKIVERVDPLKNYTINVDMSIGNLD
jgi:hypothetical protein